MSRILILVAALAGVMVFAGTSPTREPRPVHAAVTTFTTPGENVYVLPPGVARVRVEARGAPGGAGGIGCAVGGAGGVGGLIQANDVAIPPGVTTLYVEVGTAGATATAGGLGGANGGGNGGIPLATPRGNGGGGGGAADVRTVPIASPGSSASRLVVAGGGAGGGGCGVPATFPTPGGAGGAGSGPTGVAGSQGGSSINPGGFGGGGGTQTLGGSAGVGANGLAPSTPGVGPQGGNGGSNDDGPPGGSGGGGGGGFFGGGGGGAGAGDNAGGGGGGGGGGSNFAAAGSSILLNGSAAPALPAQVIITTLDPPTIAKSFTPGVVPLNGLTDITLTITNPNPPGPFSTLTGISFTDNFAALGLVIETGGVTGSPICMGTITANAGSSSISMTNGTLAAGASCQIIVRVRATLGGTHVNTTGNITSNENTAGGTATATLQVASTIPSITKSFSPTTVVVNNTSTLTLTLTNPNPVPITGVAFTDNFAAQGLVITSAAPTGTPLCTGTITAAQNTSLVSLSGGTLAANSSCQIVVTVRATLVGTQVNRTSTLTSNEFGPGAAAEASLVVTAAPTPVVPSPTPTATSTPTLVPPPPPVIPQVFQNPLALGVVQAGNRQTPTPVRPALAPAAVAPILVPIQPPRTGDAGLLGALAQALDE